VATACRAGGSASPERADGGAPPPAPAPPIGFDFPSSFACAADANAVCAPPSVDVTIGVDAALDSVSVALEGDYQDARLGADDVVLAGGRGTVKLRTASAPTTFRVVARAPGDPSTAQALDVAVSANGFATLRAIPTYAGKRPSASILATISTDHACADLATAPPPDSAPWTAAPAGIPIALSVPAGVPLAVDARVAHYAFGCADVAPLAAASSLDVSVAVYDAPLALAQTNIDAMFSFNADAAATSGWGATLDAAVTRVAGAFFGSSTPEGTALLDAVRATIASPSDQQQFEAARTNGGWDAKTATWLTAHAPAAGQSAIHDRAATWLVAAKATAPGPLLVHLAGGTTAATAAVTPTSFGSLSASAASIAPPAPFDWSADADDTVHVQGAVDLASTPLVAHLADAQAAAQNAATADVPSAIAAAIDDAGLAASLVGSGVSYGTCATACTADAFRAALIAVWTQASASPAGAGDDVHVAITASAPATVGDHAQPVGLAGAWIGQVSGAGVPTAFAVSGTLAAPPGAAH
jgi:hypothetical protein